MTSRPIAITGQGQSTFSRSTRNSLSSSASRGPSESSSYTRPVPLEFRHRRGSEASSKQSISTRDTSLSDDHPISALASPTASIKSGRHRRPRVMSVSTSSNISTRHDAVDPLMFHRRSTQLFASSPAYSQLQQFRRPSVQRTITSPEPPRPRTAVLSRTATQPRDRPYDHDLGQVYQLQSPTRSTEFVDEPTIEQPVIIHWTSDETRRKEYADIDRSRKGLRGLWNKMAPRFARSGTNSRFYNENDGSDAGSVRRIRLDLPADG